MARSPGLSLSRASQLKRIKRWKTLKELNNRAETRGPLNGAVRNRSMRAHGTSWAHLAITRPV
jgi:hypothetical protein